MLASERWLFTTFTLFTSYFTYSIVILTFNDYIACKKSFASTVLRVVKPEAVRPKADMCFLIYTLRIMLVYLIYLPRIRFNITSEKLILARYLLYYGMRAA